ncbi:MAG TPA: hypothetical protein VNT79_05845 [Phycisphaerae bacterium]|nr:hypothetical protein [Phycisphaerae bacterium]
MSHYSPRCFGATLGFLAIGIAAIPTTPALAQCPSDWLPGESAPGVTGDGTVAAAVVWDPDGNGPQPEIVALAGGFQAAGNHLTSGLAAWDGHEWSALGQTGDTSGQIRKLAIYNGDLIAAGSFTKIGGVDAANIARFDGSTWHPLGNGLNHVVRTIAVYNGELFAGGFFTDAGGPTGDYLARWNGSSWQPVGLGVNNVVSALTVHDGDLIVGGVFSTAGGAGADCIARWNGVTETWQAMEDAFDLFAVEHLTVYDGEIIAGASIYDWSTGIMEYIGRWDGSSWQMLDEGLSDHPTAFAEFNGDLIVGGLFTNASGVSALRIARWDGFNWSSVGFGMRAVGALAVFGSELIVAGAGTQPSGLMSSLVLRWDGSTVAYMGGGMDAIAYNFATYDGELIAGGWFGHVGEIVASGIAARGEDGWHLLGESGISGGDGYVWDMEVYDGSLLVTGSFTSIDGVGANGVARWDGESWQPFGDAPVGKWLVQDGTLFASGVFGTNQNVARWNPEFEFWEPLGSFPPNSGVACLAMFNGDLIAAGIGGTGVNESVWRWDFDAPGTWHPVGQHLGYATVMTLAEYNGELFAGGYIGLHKFNGTSWVTFGGGLYGSNDLVIDTIAVFDLRIHNGELIVAGSFGYVGNQQYTQDGVEANHLARWNGTSWSAFEGLAPGADDAAVTLHEHNGDLVVGGWFDMAGGMPNGFWARWGSVGCALGDVNCDALVNTSDVQPFVAGLMEPSSVDACARPAADMNGDAALDGADVQEFAACVLAGGCG